MCGCSTTPSTQAETAAQGAVFSVEDMTCAHCAGTIRSALQQGMPGSKVAIDLENQRVSVDGEAQKAASIIRDAGYEPVLVTPKTTAAVTVAPSPAA